MLAHDVDYEIIGDDLQHVELVLDLNETDLAEVAGASPRTCRFGAGKRTISVHVAWQHAFVASVSA